MNNKTALVISGIILLILLGGGFLIIKSLTKKAPAPQIEEKEEVSLLEADPSIEVNLAPTTDNKSVILTIDKIPDGTTAVEYELSYLTGEGLPKGVLGEINLEGNTSLEREILLGTCSRNTCTYDTGVTSVKVTLVFKHPNGNSQLSKEYPLE